jgi:hypothetical protein
MAEVVATHGQVSAVSGLLISAAIAPCAIMPRRDYHCTYDAFCCFHETSLG